jgi:STE24 endopeptidase
MHRLLAVTGLLLDLSVLLVFLFTGWTVTLRAWSEHLSARPAIALLIYLLLFGFITWTLGLPLDFIKGFWLEHRFGLSNLSLTGWLKDQLKGIAVGGILAALGLEFLYWTMRRWPQSWWIASGGAFAGFFILLANLAPVLFLPIFFKFKPLENAPLAQRLMGLAQRAGTNVRGVFEWKLSEKTKKANAALVGLGNTRRIILSDTLLEKFQEDEVEAVLAHEFGHHVHRHIMQGIAFQVVATFLGFYLVNLVLLRLDRFFGVRGLADFANLPLLILVGAALSLILLPAVNAHSRAMERQADAYALRAIPSKTAFVASLEKLAQLNLAERHPHPWIESIFHSHPSIEKRIAFAEKFQGGIGRSGDRVNRFPD